MHLLSFPTKPVESPGQADDGVLGSAVNEGKKGARDEALTHLDGSPVMLALGIVVGLATGPLDAQQKNLLVSKKVAAAPALDGTLDDSWKSPRPSRPRPWAARTCREARRR